jgi:hypothetical protein
MLMSLSVGNGVIMGSLLRFSTQIASAPLFDASENAAVTILQSFWSPL